MTTANDDTSIKIDADTLHHEPCVSRVSVTAGCMDKCSGAALIDADTEVPLLSLLKLVTKEHI